MDSFSWAVYDLPTFGQGIVVCRETRVCRVVLPHEDSPLDRIAELYPNAVEGGYSREVARLIASKAQTGETAGCHPFVAPATGQFLDKVLKECSRIPRGEVFTYADLAKIAGNPRAARAVGQAMARNPLPLLIPCHRVVPSVGGVGSFGGGARLKAWLLEREGATVTAA
ncbi:MAG: MGMT family protein [Candidatus Sumerlaeia bacterium]|nr:MGMT family protein [Candidatus Sumerlaeia bacterium]